MSDQCDFCSASNPITRYQTHPFGITTSEDVFPDTPVHQIGGIDYVATDDVHPIRGTGHMVDQNWLACAICADLVDRKDADGLARRCSSSFRVSAGVPIEMPDDELLAFCRTWFTVVFQQLKSGRLSYPEVQS